MTAYRNGLPQTCGGIYLTDGGLETTLIFHKGYELPFFAAFDLLNDPDGRKTLKDYFRSYSAIAADFGFGMILESATWRASRDWASKMGYSSSALAELNSLSIDILEATRAEFAYAELPFVISGQVGPRGDGYSPAKIMSADDAREYHSEQIGIFAGTHADMITAITMTYEEEAIGIADAAAEAGMPSAISFTVETDGRLPNGSGLEEAIERVDGESEVRPAYYMINCAHPSHFADALRSDGEWTLRIRGTRVNASRMSHAELDESEVLDDGDPKELAADHALLRARLPNLNIFGGCCGTDQRHVEEIGRSLKKGAAGA